MGVLRFVLGCLAIKSNDSNGKVFVASCLRNMNSDSNVQNEQIHSDDEIGRIGSNATIKENVVIVMNRDDYVANENVMKVRKDESVQSDRIQNFDKRQDCHLLKSFENDRLIYRSFYVR